MIISIVKYLKGYLRVMVTGYSPERFLNLCSNKNILIWDLVSTEEGYEFCISKDAFYELKPILKKTKTNIKILDKIGLPFFLYKYRKRKLFAIGVLLCLGLIYSLTLFVWDINVVGAYSYSEEDVVKYVETEFVQLGSLKKNVDCAKLEESLREYYENIAWISCELRGTQLTVQFKESLKQDEVGKVEGANDIVALNDGIIHNIITREGTPLVKPGDEVKQGDVLISGAIEILDDAAEVLETNYLCANGDVVAQTDYSYENSFDMSFYERNYTDKSKKFLSITCFRKVFNPYIPKIAYSSYDTLVAEKQIQIGHTYYFPLSFKLTTVREYEPKRKTYTKAEAEKKANEILKDFEQNLINKGVQILENNVKISIAGEKCVARGNIVLLEPIGKLKSIPQSEQKITPEDGGTNDEPDNPGN